MKHHNPSAEPTCVSRVERAMEAHPDDFATVRDLMTATGLVYNQVHASLFSLRKYGRVDVVVQAGRGHWFLTGADTRVRTVPERVPEHMPRKPRSVKVRALRKHTAEEAEILVLADTIRPSRIKS